MSSAPHPSTDPAADQVDDEAADAVVDHDAEIAAWRNAERIANDYRPSTYED